MTGFAAVFWGVANERCLSIFWGPDILKLDNRQSSHQGQKKTSQHYKHLLNSIQCLHCSLTIEFLKIMFCFSEGSGILVSPSHLPPNFLSVHGGDCSTTVQLLRVLLVQLKFLFIPPRTPNQWSVLLGEVSISGRTAGVATKVFKSGSGKWTLTL